MTLQETARKLCEREGGVEEVNIAQMCEILSKYSEMIAEEYNAGEFGEGNRTITEQMLLNNGLKKTNGA